MVPPRSYRPGQGIAAEIHRSAQRNRRGHGASARQTLRKAAAARTDSLPETKIFRSPFNQGEHPAQFMSGNFSSNRE
jgi:hypothetical protein